MTEKELTVELAKSYFKEASLLFQSSKEALSRGYVQLTSECESEISFLELAVEEIELKLEYAKNSRETKPKDIAFMELELKKTKERLKIGIVKSNALFNNKYNDLKLEAEKASINFEKYKSYLQFTEEEKERGFTL